MKKSLAMLFAMFMLGACSVINSDWADLVGGKTAYLGTMVYGTFSNDAKTYTAINGTEYTIEESTANSATYSYSLKGVVMSSVTFSNVDSVGGTLKLSSSSTLFPFTWSAE